MWRSLRGVLAVVVAASLATACGGDDDEPAIRAGAARTPATDGGEEGLEVAVERSRLFEQQRALAVTVRNGGDAPVVVSAVRLGEGRYEEGPPADRTVTVPVGAEVSFPLPYGRARCDDAEDQLVVHLEVDGQPVTRRAAMSGQVDRAHRRECASAAALEAVDLVFGDDWELVGPRQARGSLEIEPLGDRDVALVDITTSIVFVTEVPESSRDEGAVVLEVFAARCDTHALIESKKTFTFTASVAVDGDEPVPVELVPGPGPARGALQQALEGCIEAGDGG